MADVSTVIVGVRRIISADRTNFPSGRPARMTIAPDNGVGATIVVPYAPQEVDHNDRGSEWTVLERPGLYDATYRKKPRLNRMTFSIMVVDKNVYQTFLPFQQSTVTTALSILRALDDYATKGVRLRVAYGYFETGMWYLESCPFKTLMRDPTTDEVTRAEVTLTFIKAGSSPSGVGPITGGLTPPVYVIQPWVPPPSSAPTPPAWVPPPRPAGRPPWKVKSGDTLWQISISVYGTPNNWTKIADANGIRDPRKLRTGIFLQLP